MTKLQTVISKFEALPLEEQDRLAYLLTDFIAPKNTIFTLSEEDLKDLDDRLAHVDSEPTFSIEETFKDFK